MKESTNMKSVVLAEKPSVARDIARVLGCRKKGDGFLEGDRYIVTWALGHLVTLADPDNYDQKYKAWRLEDLPMLPEKMNTLVITKTRAQFSAVAKQLRRADVSDIIIATDAGREGELVARLIIKQAKVRKPYKRLWISSVTDKAIKDGFNKLQDGKLYDNLYHSAMARAKADWYVGINATRALTTKYNAQLSSGRVQTPTLAMIAMREEEIKQFVPKKYYGIQVLAKNVIFTWNDQKSGNNNVFDEAYVDTIVKKLQGAAIKITDITTKRKNTPAPLLYDLTELQRDANKKYGLSAKQTLSIMQSLYEYHKVLTYPRTDSRYISQDIVGTLKDRVQAISLGQYATLARQILQKPIQMQKNVINDNKVTDHHAIIPTEQKPNLAGLSDQESKIYDLVVRRFLAVLLPSFSYDETKFMANVANEFFYARGKQIVENGWKNAYQRGDLEEDEDDQNLPPLSEGMSLTLEKISRTSGVTSPPSRFSEATLLSAMEQPTKYVKGLGKDVKQQLDEAGGLGTVATRADIIEKLFNSFVIEKKEQAIYMTPKGLQLLELAPTKLCSPLLTAQWESQLSAIAKGQQKEAQFMTEIMSYTKQLVQEIKGSTATFKHQNITAKACPTCGLPMLEVNGKKGKMLVCSDRSCGTRKNVSFVTQARCPECKKKLELFGDGDGRIFVCKCGYREKLSAFEKRKAQTSGSSASKSEVQQYLKKNQKAEPAAPNPFAKAFAQLDSKK